jgi:hypothetical protein
MGWVPKLAKLQMPSYEVLADAFKRVRLFIGGFSGNGALLAQSLRLSAQPCSPTACVPLVCPRRLALGGLGKPSRGTLEIT